MPTYDYECLDCKHQFSVTHSISEHDTTKVACPECKKDNVRQLVTTFTAKTHRKS